MVPEACSTMCIGDTFHNLFRQKLLRAGSCPSVSACRASLSLWWPHLTALQDCDGECSGMPGKGIHFGLPQLSSVIVSDASGVVLGVLWITVKLETSGSQINSWE